MKLKNKQMVQDKEHLWNSFIRLGEMIGDGDHEPWVEKEYKRLLKILCPPTEEQKRAKKELRQKRNKVIDEIIKERIQKDTCECTGGLKQTRSGSKVVQCTICQKKYVYKSKKKKKQ